MSPQNETTQLDIDPNQRHKPDLTEIKRILREISPSTHKLRDEKAGLNNILLRPQYFKETPPKLRNVIILPSCSINIIFRLFLS